MVGASGQDEGHQHGSDIRNEVGGLIEGIVVDVLSRAEVEKTRFLPDGYGVRINGSRAFRAT